MIFHNVAALAALTLSAAIGSPAAAQNVGVMRENAEHVRIWNAFADGILRVHKYWLDTRAVETSERVGGYKRMLDYYREVEVRDAATGRLLSRVRWERENPKIAHMMEVFFYDDRGRLSIDFSATYLPGYHNAPYQTLINLHQRDDELRAFRQFDASGNRIYEHCEGEFFDRPVDISLEDGEIPPPPDVVPDEVYVSCFGLLPVTVDRYLWPDALVPGIAPVAETGDDGALTVDKVERRIAELSRRIEAAPADARLRVQRGRDLFLVHRFHEAIEDFTKALALNDDLDSAYFGRGLALGRIGEIDRGIEDLTHYIRRNPESSLAYTKRGVRYIWKEDFESARRDLLMAVKLDDANAEAHDDLGVALFQLDQVQEALKHFEKAKLLEPSYYKVHHNIAMVHYMTGGLDHALEAVNDSLRLYSANRNSLLLKATILEGLGRDAEADGLRKRAALLPQGNWSEHSAIR